MQTIDVIVFVEDQGGKKMEVEADKFHGNNFTISLSDLDYSECTPLKLLYRT